MPKNFKGSESKKVTLSLASSSQTKIKKGAFSGSKVKKAVVSGLNKKEFEKVQKKLRNRQVSKVSKIVKK